MFPDDIPEPDIPENSLNPEQRRGIILGHLSALITRNFSATQALKFYRERGLGIRSSDFNSLYLSYGSNFGDAQRVQGLEKPSQITDEFLGRGDISGHGRYLFIAEINYTDLTSEEPQIGHFGFYTDRLLSKGEILDIIKQRATESDSYRKSEVNRVNLLRGYKLDM